MPTIYLSAKGPRCDVASAHPVVILDKHGAFDISLVTDLPLFIDPFLLFNSKKKRYRILHDDIIRLAQNTYTEAHQRIAFLKDVIEDKGGHRIFFVDGKPIVRESDIHIMYRLVWFDTPSDVSREVNDGRGPADFKISRGMHDKTILEFKLAKNTSLERTLKHQAEIYQKASDAGRAIKVIVFFSDAELEKVNGILKRAGLTGNPDIVLIDARRDNKPSASKS